ncbi:hypothetical protein K461DRAFT_230129 [Myriangium duriaei CBS 260.36]|uniref:Uncharacterized protein n=1 Tax=Myriangium duriaei CBS 260.36 TaxID=1168546 RepID=A0A9P4MEM5_9PEZI|nr:hypothetical protein K461DRAFT_230129 [Myriangium duriaei CBS 260.36]
MSPSDSKVSSPGSGDSNGKSESSSSKSNPLIQELPASSHKSDTVSHKSGDSAQKSSASPPPATDPELKDWHHISSLTTKDGSYFRVKFDDLPAMNPNIIPHPSKADTWYVVAQRFKFTSFEQFWFTELVCDASFKNEVLQCQESPMILPIAATASGKCEGEISGFVQNVGPHDGRVFYGPDSPYIIYGSNSKHNCFGLWTQDFRMLVASNSTSNFEEGFRFPVDLQRPPPYRPVEKNWFMFWDAQKQPYLHYDILPQRVFAKLNINGSVGPDLGEVTRVADNKCLNAYIPKIPKDATEDIHQATNSIAVSLCKRSDPTCKRTVDNTYILNVYQHKKYYFYHGVYEPYVMLHQENAPFGLYGVSSKPIWVAGRKKEITLSNGQVQKEMVYVTSVNWKKAGNNYHGFLDDVLMVGFGVEDKSAGAIDVTAEDLIGKLSLCSNVK